MSFDGLYPLLDITTTLDPRFNIAYRFGAIFLSAKYPEGADSPQLAVAPHPAEVFPPKEHELRPIGNMQPVGGGLAGGFAIAIACAETGSVWKPSTRRKEV